MPATRILIVTNGHLARNPRVLKEATALGDAGYAVTVLGVCNHPPSVQLDASLAAAAPFRLRQVDLLASDRCTRLTRLRGRLARFLAARGFPASIESLGPASLLLALAREEDFDLLIAHNEIGHWVGLRLLDEGRRVAADIEDWHSEDLLPAARSRRPLALLRRQEQRLLREAAYTTTTSHALADALHARYGGRLPAVVANSFSLQPPPACAIADVAPSFFWFSQTLGPGRGLEAFLAAWSRTQNPSRLVLLGEPTEAFDRRILAQLPSAFRPRVSFLPLVPPRDLPALIARHHIGLALEETSPPSRDLTITNKILQYLNAGLAVVATPTAGQREVFSRSPEIGVLVDPADTAAFAEKLDALLSDRVALAARRHAARRLAEEVYCWEKEIPRVRQLAADAALPGHRL